MSELSDRLRNWSGMPRISENLALDLRDAAEAIDAKAKKAPAQFRRITKRTKITVPCVIARKVAVRDGVDLPPRLRGELLNTEAEVALLRDHYTHWLPFAWPEVRG